LSGQNISLCVLSYFVAGQLVAHHKERKPGSDKNGREKLSRKARRYTQDYTKILIQLNMKFGPSRFRIQAHSHRLHDLPNLQALPNLFPTKLSASISTVPFRDGAT
jgi:hypothetical protein